MELINHHIGLELVQNRTFYSMWKHEDVTSKDSYDRLCTSHFESLNARASNCGCRLESKYSRRVKHNRCTCPS